MTGRIDEAMGQPAQPWEGLQDLEGVLRGEDKFTPLQRHFLRRLVHLVTLRRQSQNLPPQSRRMLDHAIFSTYVDCLDQGVGATAQAIVQQIAPKPTSTPHS